MIFSLPLLAPPSNLHGGRGRGDTHLLPPQTRSQRDRKESRGALRRDLLDPGRCLLSSGIEQLYQDCQSVLAKAGSGAEWGIDAGCKSHSLFISSSVLLLTLRHDLDLHIDPLTTRMNG